MINEHPKHRRITMYNFDEIIDRRNTNALNTDGFRGYIFHAGP